MDDIKKNSIGHLVKKILRGNKRNNYDEQPFLTNYNNQPHNNSIIYDNILQVIGNTPMVKLNRVPKDHGLECNFYVKCEYLNPGGSIKDRIGHSMVVDAQVTGKAKAGTRFVEPTSGNTGIGVALTAAVFGYNCTIVTPDKNSDEKMSTIDVLGADVVQTPAMAPYGDPNNFASVAKKIIEEDPNAMSLDQYTNEVNPLTHYDETAKEILAAVPDLDMIVIGAGTGGTLTGVGRKVKQQCPKCVVVAVDPQGSVMFQGGEPKLFLVEGIGGDFEPKVLDKSVADKVIHPNDNESFNMSRALIRREGLLCGGSSGAAMYSAIEAAKELKLGAGKSVVVILPDGIRNYMTKFVSDQWMEAQLFKDPPERDYVWWNRSISNLKIDRTIPLISEFASCKEAISTMGSEHNVAIVVNAEGYYKGVISKNSLRGDATNPKRKGECFNLNDPVNRHLMKNHYKIIENRGRPTAGLASRILDVAPFLVVVEEIDYDKTVIGYLPRGVITAEAMLDFILEHQDN